MQSYLCAMFNSSLGSQTPSDEFLVFSIVARNRIAYHTLQASYLADQFTRFYQKNKMAQLFHWIRTS